MLLVVAATAVAAQAVVVAGLALATARPMPELTVWDLLGLWTQADPSSTTGLPVWPALHWALVGLLVLVVLVPLAFWLRWHERRNRTQALALRKGTASRRELLKYAGARQLVARAARLRPSLAKQRRIRPEQLGYRLGTSKGVSVWMSVEDSMILVGPSRSGKGRNFIVPMLRSAMGAVVTTSTRPDNLYLTIEHRERVGGPAYVFDPMGVAKGVGHTLHWSPIDGAEDLDVAMRRLQSLIPSDGFAGVQNSSYWEATSKKIILALFHAAALDGRTIEDFWQWISDPNLARSDALEILSTHPDADRATARSLAAVLSGTAEQRGNDWASAYADVAYMASPKVRASMTRTPDSLDFNPATFVTSRGTMYLVGDSLTIDSFEPLIVALIDELTTAAQLVAGESAGARLDPPLQLLLDEAASFKIPTLPKLVFHAGGSGITVVVALQSLGQAAAAWGRDHADAMWGAASIRAILPGTIDAKHLRDLEVVAGQIEFQRDSVTVGEHGSSRSYAQTRRSVLDPATMRTLERESALVLSRHLKPIVLLLSAGPRRVDPASRDDETLRTRRTPQRHSETLRF